MGKQACLQDFLPKMLAPIRNCILQQTTCQCWVWHRFQGCPVVAAATPAQTGATDVANAVLDGVDSILLGAGVYMADSTCWSIAEVQRQPRRVQVAFIVAADGLQRFKAKPGRPLAQLASLRGLFVLGQELLDAHLVKDLQGSSHVCSHYKALTNTMPSHLADTTALATGCQSYAGAQPKPVQGVRQVSCEGHAGNRTGDCASTAWKMWTMLTCRSRRCHDAQI